MPLAVLLIVAGLHVPLIPFGDVVDNVGTVPPIHIGEIAAKFGAVIEGQAVLQVVVIDDTQETPLAVNVKVTEVPGFKPVTVKFDGETQVPFTGGPPAIE